jgi:hypothetical protein
MRVTTTLITGLFLLTACSGGSSRPTAYKDGVKYEYDGGNHWCIQKDEKQAKKDSSR